LISNSVTKRLIQAAVLSSTLVLSACDPLTDLIFDCIDDDGPVLRPRVIPNPVLNQTYDVRITASINNEPYDDRFVYDINVSQGLPPGLTAEVFERRIRITGTPTELGNYNFDISVRVDEPYQTVTYNHNEGTSSGLCRHHTHKIYRVDVLQGN